MNSGSFSFDHPFFLGFDQFEKELERLKKSASGYPPYNVEQLDGNTLRITMEVTGFNASNLDIEIENSHLSVRGKQSEGGYDKNSSAHHDITTRQFQRSFIMAEGLEIKGATLNKDLLYIDLQRIEKDRDIQKIEIEKSSAGDNIDIDVPASQKK